MFGDKIAGKVFSFQSFGFVKETKTLYKQVLLRKAAYNLH